MYRAVQPWGQEFLAEAVGLTLKQIQGCEIGSKRISPSQLYEFATVLDVPVSYFFEGVSSSNSKRPAMPKGSVRPGYH